MSQQTLVTYVTAHCFYRCGHVEHGTPDTCHDAMEHHYRDRHEIDHQRLMERVKRGEGR